MNFLASVLASIAGLTLATAAGFVSTFPEHPLSPAIPSNTPPINVPAYIPYIHPFMTVRLPRSFSCEPARLIWRLGWMQQGPDRTPPADTKFYNRAIYKRLQKHPGRFWRRGQAPAVAHSRRLSRRRDGRIGAGRIGAGHILIHLFIARRNQSERE